MGASRDRRLRTMTALAALAGLAVLAGLCLAGCGGDGEARDEELDLLAGWMAGSFSSQEQAAADEDYFDIRLHMTPIWTGRQQARWFYVEQAVADKQDRPYRQRVYRLSRRSPGLIESAVFLLPGPERFVGAWRDTALLASLAPDSLIPREGCEILLERIDAETFAGGTHEKDCPSELRGASYATSEATIRRDGMVSWDRGWDASGAQVWGATRSGYVFRKYDPEEGEDPGAADDS